MTTYYYYNTATNTASVTTTSSTSSSLVSFSDSTKLSEFLEDKPMYSATYSSSSGIWSSSLSSTELSTFAETLKSDIDTQINTIYNSYTQFYIENNLRYNQAIYYKDASFSGTVPSMIQALADSEAISAEAAALQVITEIDFQNDFLEILGNFRMYKNIISKLSTASDMQTFYKYLYSEISAAYEDGKVFKTYTQKSLSEMLTACSISTSILTVVSYSSVSSLIANVSSIISSGTASQTSGLSYSATTLIADAEQDYTLLEKDLSSSGITSTETTEINTALEDLKDAI